MVTHRKFGTRRAAGFTLIEMLVVLAIVALLLTIAVPRYFGSLERSRETALRMNLKILRVTIDKFYADRGKYPDSLAELVEQKYLLAIPVDPITESKTSWLTVDSPEPEAKGVIDVKSGASGSSTDGVAYANY